MHDGLDLFFLIPCSSCAMQPQSMIQLSRTQDEEVGDGTTSVIILGERLEIARGSLSYSDEC